MSLDEYCREIESYLCRKNGGHLIRIVGPSFDRVSAWAAGGIPLKLVCRGIDRYVERIRRPGPRRRPVRIDHCEADVLDVFEEWRRALGVPAALGEEPSVEIEGRRRGSLGAHLDRVMLRLTSARAGGSVGPDLDRLIDALAVELDGAREAAKRIRGEARRALVERLDAIDAELIHAARLTLDEPRRAALEREVEEEVGAFRGRMRPDAFARARQAALDRLMRERLGLPMVAFRG